MTDLAPENPAFLRPPKHRGWGLFLCGMCELVYIEVSYDSLASKAQKDSTRNTVFWGGFGSKLAVSAQGSKYRLASPLLPPKCRLTPTAAVFAHVAT